MNLFELSALYVNRVQSFSSFLKFKRYFVVLLDFMY